jgi:hypothetical protein
MAKAALNSVIRGLLSAQAHRGSSDRHLLERFIPPGLRRVGRWVIRQRREVWWHCVLLLMPNK